MSEVGEFISVEPNDAGGWSLVAWCEDGEANVVYVFMRRDEADAACDAVKNALCTWPGWAKP